MNIAIKSPTPPAISANVKSWLPKPKKLLIAGEWMEARSGKTFAVEDPATRETMILLTSPKGMLPTLTGL